VNQYPPPYSQPPYGMHYAYPARPADPRRHARRSAILMGVIGGLGLLLAGMMFVTGKLATPQMIATTPQAQQFQKIEMQTGMTFQQMANMVALMMGVPAAVFAGLAIFVWRGGRGAVMTGLVFTVCVTGFLTLQTLAGLAMGDAGAICMGVLMVGMLAWLCAWLWQARRAIPLVEAMRYAQAAGAAAPPPATWPTPPAHAHVPMYAPPAQHPSAFNPNAPSPFNAGPPPTGGMDPLQAASLQPPVAPPGYVPSSDAPSRRPVVYGYAQPPPETQGAQGTSPAAAASPRDAGSPAPAQRESNTSKQTEG
jgi:hypothetical protein